ncbi:hypothetical protein [Cellulomonas sp. URHB0016]
MSAFQTVASQLAGLAVGAARAVVADHVAPVLPTDHRLRTWSGTDEGGPRPWPALMTSPRCLVSVGSEAVTAMDAFVATASAVGMRVERLVGRDGIPVCIVRERHPDALEAAGMVAGVVEWAGPVGTSVNVRGFALAGGGCVLEVDVEDKGGDRTLSRQFAGMLERFASSSAAAGVPVQVGRWVDRRPVRWAQGGRRRAGAAPADR